MKESKVKSYLYCVPCHEETPHIILYIDNEIKSVECEICARKQEFKFDINKKFYKELYYRISSKPSRITQEYRQDLNHFILGFPLRIASKPYRLMKDLNSAREIIKRYKE
jgi:hypothetical protein